MKIGDAVEVLDPGLARMRAMMAQFGADPGPNNLGWVEDFMDNGDILVRFPIGDDDPDKHGQVAPYPPHMVRLRTDK